MKEKQDILDRIGRRSGMTVPEHYFADFSAEMMSRLPEKPVESSGKVLPRSVWQRVRPYIYLAAMFSGVNDVVVQRHKRTRRQPVHGRQSHTGGRFLQRPIL